MTEFEKACRLSCEEWAQSLPDAPAYTLSRKGKKRLNAIVDRMEEGTLRRYSKRTTRYALVAAVAAVLFTATTVFAVVGQQEFGIFKKSDMAQYTVNGSSGRSAAGDLTVSYVVDGFELVDTEYNDGLISLLIYEAKSGTSYSISKLPDDRNFTFDTEEYEASILSVNGIEYTYYKSDKDYNGLIWNNGGYIFCISGNISLDDALSVAESTK